MAQRGNRGGRSNTRKPVTIDLEAKPDDAETTTASDDSTQKVTVKDDTVTQNTETLSEATQAAEPVAMDQLSTESVVDDAPTPAFDKPVPDKESAGEPESNASDDGVSNDAAGIAAAAGSTTIVQKRGVSAIGGGIVGGLLTLVGAAGLQSAGMLPSFGMADAPVVQPAPMVDLSPMEAQIAALQSAMDTMRSSAGSADGSVVTLPDDIRSQLESAADAAAQANAQTEAVQTELAGLAERVDALQQAVSSGEAGDGAGLEAIASRIDALEAQASDVAAADAPEAAIAFDAAAAVAALQPSLDGINEQINLLSGDVDAVSQTLEGVTGEVATLQQGVTTLTNNQTATGDQMAALSDQVAANAGRLEQSGAGNTVAKAIAASGLKSAADRGLPFMAELETFASTGGDPEALTTLRDFAAAGVPTRAQLIEQFGPVASAIVASGQGLNEDASITDRLMNSARSLVQVRDLNEVEGESVTAITNRIDAALKADDLDNALAQWETLPDSAKQASSDFVDRLRARQNVDGLLNNVLTQAMAATAPSANQ